MRPWWALVSICALGCEGDPDAATPYANTDPYANWVTTAERDASWGCDDLCQDADNLGQMACLVNEITAMGFNLLNEPSCPSSWGQTVTEGQCIVCANSLGLSQGQCSAIGTGCNL